MSASLSQQQLAQRSGLSLKAIIRAEDAVAKGQGGAVLNAADIDRLAAALGTTASDLKG